MPGQEIPGGERQLVRTVTECLGVTESGSAAWRGYRYFYRHRPRVMLAIRGVELAVLLAGPLLGDAIGMVIGGAIFIASEYFSPRIAHRVIEGRAAIVPPSLQASGEASVGDRPPFPNLPAGAPHLPPDSGTN